MRRGKNEGSTDPEKDYVVTDFYNSIQFTQIIQLLNCETLDDVVSLLKDGISIQFACLMVILQKNSNSLTIRKL